MQSPEDARAALDTLKAPLAVKLQSADMLHKSEHGGVRLGLTSADEIADAVREMMDIAKAGSLRLDGILLQEMTPVAQELIVGFRRDPVFGPLLLIGRGGVEVELRPDRAMAYLPMPAQAISAMIHNLDSAPLFSGYRGGPTGDIATLAQELSRLGDAFAADESIEEIEINPLALSRDGSFVALDALSLHRHVAQSGRADVQSTAGSSKASAE